MKYLLLTFGKEQYWYALDDAGYANRQVIQDEDGQIHISCLEDCLAEDPIEEENMDGDVIHLSKQEFEVFWQSVLKRHRKQWEEIKKTYPLGAYVQGTYRYSYPQGSIIKSDDFIAIYQGKEAFSLHKLVRYQVKSYDDVNMWLVVE